MILINRTETDPFFNIAAEEYFLKNFKDDILMIWQSTPSVIIGKHQNTMAEVNVGFAERNNIPIIRRITGGGTVYHDDGNINYSIITQSENREKLVDFHGSTEPIISFLNSMGLVAIFSGKNNLTIDGKKFSGNSAHVFKNRILHHGTILFDSKLETLEKAITPPKYSISDKAVKSVRATVTNLLPLIKEIDTIEDFRNSLITFLMNHLSIKEEYNLTPTDNEEITKLAETKYNTWEWNFGYSPSYTIENSWDDASINMIVEKGIIKEIEITGKIKSRDMVTNLLTGLPVNKESIGNIFSSLSFSKKQSNHYFRLLGLM